MRVIIAGGGTGGLATTIALRRLGIDPLVLEQAPAFTAIGAGLGLQVNTMKAITHIGGDRHWRETSTIIDGGVQVGLEDGQPISTSYDQLAERFGEHYYCGHRADLMTSLLEVLPPEAVRVGSRVVAVEETSDDVAVQLETGEEIRGDLLVGADGLRSRVRSLLFEEPEARFTGVVVWRGLMPAAKVPERYYGKIWSWLGPRRHVLVYSLRNSAQPDPVYMFSGFVPANEVQRESWTASGDIEDLRESLEGACSDLHELLDQMDSTLITGIYFRDPLQRWGTDRVVLLGDAAHPAPPSAGQGAGMALEDAVMLAACLERNGPEDVSGAIKEYEYRRMPRTVRMLESSRVNLANSQQSDPIQVRARNGYYRGLRKLSPHGPPMAEWLLGHDPVGAANRTPEEFEQAVAIPPNPLRRPEAKRSFDAWRSALSLENRANGWLGERAGYEEFAEREFPPPAGVVTEAIVCDGVPALRVDPAASAGSGPLVLHLHGGGYTMGSARGSTRLAAGLAEAVDGRAISVDYRLAPEHPYPAALDDVTRAYRWAVAEHPGVPVIVSGECAGGGLALALVLGLRDAGDPLPVVLHLVSPFCDLTMSSNTLSSDTTKEPWLNPIFATQLAASYVQDSDPTLPGVSPLLGAMAGLPPLLVQVARDEALFPQAERLVTTAGAAGVEAVLDAVDDSVHSFVLFEHLPESGSALSEFGTFVRDR